MSDAGGHSRRLLWLEAGSKSARVAASCQLPEHCARQPELRLNYEV
jgi:hypothetical protein